MPQASAAEWMISMRVTYFIGSTTGGGAERVICELATYMSENGHYSEILTVTETERSYDIGNKVVRSTIDTKHKISCNRIRLIVKMIKLFLFILRNRTDMYVVFLPDTIKAFMIFRKLVRVPVIVSERNNPESYSEELQLEMRRAFAKAEGAVFQTENAKNFYYENCDESICNAVVIPNAIAGKLPTPYIGERKEIIVSVGRFKEQKNFTLLIKAFADVHKEFPTYRLMIYGEGELLDSYIRLCKELHIESAVIFPGFVNNVAEKIKDSEMFVLSSDYEGMPNALIEAMAIGLPCISTDCRGGGARYLIEHERNGLLVEVNNQEALKEAMLKLINNKEISKKLAYRALEINDILSKQRIYALWEKYLCSYNEIYK